MFSLSWHFSHFDVVPRQIVGDKKKLLKISPASRRCRFCNEARSALRMKKAAVYRKDKILLSPGAFLPDEKYPELYDCPTLLESRRSSFTRRSHFPLMLFLQARHKPTAITPCPAACGSSGFRLLPLLQIPFTNGATHSTIVFLTIFHSLIVR